MEDYVDRTRNVDVIGHVVPHELESLMLHQVGNVPVGPGQKIADCDNGIAICEKTVTEV